MKITQSKAGKKIVVKTRNIPLAVFYGVCGIMVWFFGTLFSKEADEQVVTIVVATLISVLALSIVRALFRTVTLTIDAEYITVFDGLFFIGVKRRTAVRFIRDIYVNRERHAGGQYQNLPRPGTISNHLQIDGAPGLTLLKNCVPTETLVAVQKEIEAAIGRK
jgi:hypothetical protein